MMDDDKIVSLDIKSVDPELYQAAITNDYIAISNIIAQKHIENGGIKVDTNGNISTEDMESIIGQTLILMVFIQEYHSNPMFEGMENSRLMKKCEQLRLKLLEPENWN